MNTVVTGASGYVGGSLTPLLIARGHAVRCLTRSPRNLVGRFEGASIFEADLLTEPSSLRHAFEDAEVAYYLVHSMGTRNEDFAQTDRKAAIHFATAAKAAGVKRVVYLGALGDARTKLSKHLRSRQQVGDLLRRYGPPVTEFRAAIIIGAGSASFEMVRYLTERLPIMIAPKWVSTRCQPIAVDDVLEYLLATLHLPNTAGCIYEIGGSDTVSYRELMLTYAKVRDLKRYIIDVPLFTPRLSSYWVHFVTPIPAGIARPLIDGLQSEVVVRDHAAARDFPVNPLSCLAAIRRALDRYRENKTQSTWFDALDTRRLPGEFQGVTQGMLVDRRERRSQASPQALYRVFTSLGGARGWLFGGWLWSLRGLLDWIFGGVGMRRGRRSPFGLRIGDAVDFWRVEALEPDRLLRLRAEMKTPGNAWLEFSAKPDVAGSVYQQTAFFEPRGLFGQLYWYVLGPVHYAIFTGLADRIVAEARRVGSESLNSSSA